jgi:hypothetical protein
MALALALGITACGDSRQSKSEQIQRYLVENLAVMGGDAHCSTAANGKVSCRARRAGGGTVTASSTGPKPPR